MISQHCGKRLTPLYCREATYTENMTTKEKTPLRHSWVCKVCGRKFEQRIRLAKQK